MRRFGKSSRSFQIQLLNDPVASRISMFRPDCGGAGAKKLIFDTVCRSFYVDNRTSLLVLLEILAGNCQVYRVVLYYYHVFCFSLAVEALSVISCFCSCQVRFTCSEIAYGIKRDAVWNKMRRWLSQFDSRTRLTEVLTQHR